MDAANPLSRGDRSDAVSALQQALKRRGFDPGTPDGIFGDKTAAAVRAFQVDAFVTGVADAATQRALGLGGQPAAAPAVVATAAVTVDIVARMFDPATPRGNIERHLPVVLGALDAAGLSDKQMVCMALASIRAESEGFTPIDEGVSKYNTAPGAHPFNLYDDRSDIGNRGWPDGERYKGSGFGQLTGRYNYRVVGAAIGVDLEARPELANEPDIAAAVLAAFLKRKETAIRQALDRGDLAAARRLYNGGSHGLGRFTEAYRAGMALIPGE